VKPIDIITEQADATVAVIAEKATDAPRSMVMIDAEALFTSPRGGTADCADTVLRSHSSAVFLVIDPMTGDSTLTQNLVALGHIARFGSYKALFTLCEIGPTLVVRLTQALSRMRSSTALFRTRLHHPQPTSVEVPLGI